MDHRFVNGNNRAANGFFLTSSRDASPGEKKVYEEAVKCASRGLFDRKLRSSNVLQNLALFDQLTSDVEGVIDAVSKDANFEVANKTAYAYLVTMACMSAYSAKIRHMMSKDSEAA